MILDDTTKPRECIKFLTLKPLRFGDWEQVRAVQILSAAEELLDFAKVCPDCLGKGEIEEPEPGHCDECGRPCSFCANGKTTAEKCEECKGGGELTWTRDEVYALPVGQILRLLGRPPLTRTA